MLVRRTPTLIDRFFEDWTRSVSESNGEGRALALDVHETENQYIVKTDIPGVDAEDIDIRMQDNTLTIVAETKFERTEEEEGETILRERHYGKFSRSLRLPHDVNSDAVEADYDNGVLTVTVPKSEESQPRRIEVKRGRS